VNLLEVKNLQSLFSGETRIVQRVKAYVKAVRRELDRRAGERLGLVGREGCGPKQRSVRAIIRLIDPTAGKGFSRAKTLPTWAALKFGSRRRRFQMIFQDPTARSTRADRRADIGEALDIPPPGREFRGAPATDHRMRKTSD